MTGYLDFYEPGDMDYIRATLAKAQAHGISVDELSKTAEYAQSLAEWDWAVSLLCHMTLQNKSA